MDKLKKSLYRVIYSDKQQRQRRAMVVLIVDVHGGHWPSYEDHPATRLLRSRLGYPAEVHDVKRMKIDLHIE